jgi:hypothetical protein
MFITTPTQLELKEVITMKAYVFLIVALMMAFTVSAACNTYETVKVYGPYNVYKPTCRSISTYDFSDNPLYSGANYQHSWTWKKQISTEKPDCEQYDSGWSIGYRKYHKACSC